jgi:hypothetical protein
VQAPPVDETAVRARRRGHDIEAQVTLEELFGYDAARGGSEKGTDQTVDVRIPAGIKDGARIAQPARAAARAGAGSSGDLFFGPCAAP